MNVDKDDLAGIFDSMLSVAKAAAPLIGHGAPEAIALGERVVEMIDQAGVTFGKDGAPTELLQQRDRLDQAMQKHVAATAAKLRG